MAQAIQPVTAERHAHKKWLRPAGYAFAANDHIVPVIANEMAAAGRAFPLCFADLKPQPVLVALMGFRPGKSLFVGPNGRWLGSYVPVSLQRYPFSLARTGPTNFVLCIDEASGLVRDTAVGEEGTRFFDLEGKLTAQTRQVLETLARNAQSEEVMRRATASLISRNLLEPWPLTTVGDEGEAQIKGLLRVNEKALNALPAADLAAIREEGGLPLAYCQLFSMGNVNGLSGLARLHQDHATRERERMRVPEHSFLPEDDGNLKIDWDALLKNL